jgi:PAS domain S-box-containing protein
LTRFEALTPVALAVGGAALLKASGDAAAWMYVVLAVVGFAGLTGFLRRSGPELVVVRAVVVLAGAVLLSAVTDGTSSAFRYWFVGAAVAYPLVLPDRWATGYPMAAALLYLSLAVAPGAQEPLAEVAAWGLLMVLVGLVVAVLGQTSSQLASERTVATQQMHLARGRLAAAFAAASSGMALVDESGVILRGNQALCDMLGRSEAELASTDWRGLILPEDVTHLETAIGELLAGTVDSVQQEVRLLRKGGGMGWALLGASVVDREADDRQLFIHAQDITERVLATSRLRESEEHFRNLFGRSPVATWEQDFSRVVPWLEEIRAKGVSDIRRYLEDRPAEVQHALDLIQVRDANEAAVSLIESESREALLGSISADNYIEGSANALIDQATALWEGQDRAETAFSGTTKGGRAIDGVVHWALPRVNGRLQPSKAVVTVSDVTEYRRAAQALRTLEQRLRAVVSAAPIILFAVDRYGVLTLAEGEGLSVLGLASGEPLGRSVFEIFRESPQFLKAVRRAIGGESFTTTVELGVGVFDLRMSPAVEDGTVTGAIGVANDITMRKRTAERLEQLVRSKDEFVASVSHELRTPLTAVVGFATELRDQHDELSHRDARGYIELIAGQAMEVADLVEDLLVAARVDMDTVSVFPEPVDVWGQVDGVVQSWSEELAANVTKQGPEFKAYADPIRFRQILRNLLSNAQRYGGSEVVVTAERRGENVVLTVRDNGPGIPERERDGIFDPYRRAHEGAGQPLSVGLGLTVSRQLARLMDGDLEYRYVDGWSEFALTLPAVL